MQSLLPRSGDIPRWAWEHEALHSWVSEMALEPRSNERKALLLLQWLAEYCLVFFDSLAVTKVKFAVSFLMGQELPSAYYMCSEEEHGKQVLTY